MVKGVLMSDASEQSAAPDLRSLIMSAPEDLWKKLSQALGASTREQAISMVESDESAAATASRILGGGPSQQSSVMTDSTVAAAAPSDAADLLFPSMARRKKQGVQF